MSRHVPRGGRGQSTAACAPHAGSARISGDDVTLTTQWQRLEVPLQGKESSGLKNSFVIRLYGQSSTVTVYLDTIRSIR